MKPFLKKLSVQNFGPIGSTELTLSRLHALVGPNDTGKSSLLRCIQHVSQLVALPTPRPHELERPGFSFRVATSDGAWWDAQRDERSHISGQARDNAGAESDAFRCVGAVLRNVRVLRLDPDEIRMATPLLADGAALDFQNERGRGLGSVLDALFSRRAQTFLELQSRLGQLFSSVDGFRLFTTSAGRQVGIRLKDGTEVPPSAMSEGMLYFLAFSVVPYIQPSSILLVEEPENGLHPSRIADVMKVLRAVSETTQVIIATHSPLVVNELQPDEVTIVTRPPDRGTTCTPMSATPNFKKRSEVYALGELWLSYANGIDEAPLLTGTR